MTVFRNVVFVAALAGLLSGILMAAMQAYAAEAGKVARDQLDPAKGQPKGRAA